MARDVLIEEASISPLLLEAEIRDGSPLGHFQHSEGKRTVIIAMYAILALLPCGFFIGLALHGVVWGYAVAVALFAGMTSLAYAARRVEIVVTTTGVIIQGIISRYSYRWSDVDEFRSGSFVTATSRLPVRKTYLILTEAARKRLGYWSGWIELPSDFGMSSNNLVRDLNELRQRSSAATR